MKKVILTIATIATLFSCTTEDYCGIVTGMQQGNNNYKIQLDNGEYHRVTFDVYTELQQNEYACIY